MKVNHFIPTLYSLEPISEDLFNLHGRLLDRYFWEDAFVIAVGVYPSFFDLWQDSVVPQLPVLAESLEHPWCDAFRELTEKNNDTIS